MSARFLFDVAFDTWCQLYFDIHAGEFHLQTELSVEETNYLKCDIWVQSDGNVYGILMGLSTRNVLPQITIAKLAFKLMNVTFII